MSVRSARVAELATLAAFVLIGLALGPAVSRGPLAPGVADLPLPEAAQELADLSQALRGLHRRLGPVQSGDWLESHWEVGQTFRQFLSDRPGPVDQSLTTLYILPLDAGSSVQGEQQRIVQQTAEFLAAFFGKPVEILNRVPLEEVPSEAQRLRSDGVSRQLQTDWLLDHILLPRRPADAIALLGLTTDDLWPGPGGNFVFGQASLSERIGVWSLARNGDPAEGGAARRQCLRRTVRTAVHETGHMLGIRHCIASECGMNGSNNREESDRRPIEFCPECQAKIWWSCRVDPIERCHALEKLSVSDGLEQEAQLFRLEAETLQRAARAAPRQRREQMIVPSGVDGTDAE